MSIKFKRVSVKKEALNHHLLIVLISLVAAHFVVVNNAPETWIELWMLDFYYKSVAYSMVVALMLIYYIRFITVKINHWQNGFKLNKERLRQQLFFGLGGAILIEFVLAFILYQMHGSNIFNNGYFNKLFAMIMLFIMVINVCYCFYHYYLEQKQMPAQTVVITETKKEVRYKFLQAPTPNQLTETHIPFLIYLKLKTPLAYDGKGASMNWLPNIEDSMKQLPPNDYFQINRHTIIHRAIVKTVLPYDKYHLIVIPIFGIPPSLITSRRKTPSFKKWLDQHH